MRITPYIQRRVVTVKPSDSAMDARVLLERHHIHQLPVVAHDRLVGIVTDRDLRDAFPSTLESEGHNGRRHHEVDPEHVRVRDVMSPHVFSLGADDSVREAAGLLRRRGIGALPILDQRGRLFGILTRSDLLKALEDQDHEL
jgi:acetoin utilization protein AcuB